MVERGRLEVMETTRRGSSKLLGHLKFTLFKSSTGLCQL